MRPDIVNALKSLQVKRWRAIRGHAYDTAAGGNHYRYSSLQYRDEITGELWPKKFDDATQKQYKIQKTKEMIFKVGLQWRIQRLK